jgi:hypothetical protein
MSNPKIGGKIVNYDSKFPIQKKVIECLSNEIFDFSALEINFRSQSQMTMNMKKQ